MRSTNDIIVKHRSWNLEDLDNVAATVRYILELAKSFDIEYIIDKTGLSVATIYKILKDNRN